MITAFDAIEKLMSIASRKVELHNVQPWTENITVSDTIEAQAAELISYLARQEEYRLLVECRMSGQISDAQWQEHLKDTRFAAYLDGLPPATATIPSPSVNAVAMAPSVTARDLRNVLALLMSIDRNEIEAAGYDMPDGSWEEFREAPWTRFLKCNDACREAIVRVINGRMRGAAIHYAPITDAVTPALLADALYAFWNAALVHAQHEGNGTTYSNIGAMATGFAAVAMALREGGKP